jgi:hypothetical protein
MATGTTSSDRAGNSVDRSTSPFPGPKRGEIIGGVPPWGFRLSEDRASWVRELRAQGKGVRPIARALEAAGFRTRNGRKVVHSSVVKMLQAMERNRAAA